MIPLPDWLGDPALSPVWVVLHARLERHGPTWRGRVTVSDLDPPGQRALSSLLGRTVLRPSISLDLADLDTRFTAAGGLLAVVEAACGRDVVDRRSERERAAALREEPVAAALTILPEVPWRDEWLSQVRRVAPSVEAARSAASVLVALGADRQVSRVDLAAEVLGDAHALDDDSVVAGLVLRALALRFEAELPSASEGRRDLWRQAGVAGDEVSSTCLVLRLPVLSGPLARRSADGDPVHLTRRDLARYPIETAAGAWVLVCENPRVLEAVADSDVDVAVVCGNGSPNLVTIDVLRALARCGARLNYHGDFDWGGLAIANRLVRSVGVRPWAMSTADYLSGPEGLPLRGVAVDATWDETLSVEMVARGCAIHEESVLPDLLSRLNSGAR